MFINPPARDRPDKFYGYIKPSQRKEELQKGFIRTKQEDNPDVIEKPPDLSEEAYETGINADPNLETAEKTTEETICQARMNRRDYGMEFEDNDDEEGLEEKPPSAQKTLQALRILRRSVQHRAQSFDEHYSYERFIQRMLDN
ncbi:hypothetical protein AVEN_31437-1 [Araneus ventricosus]|uniref:Uncharacterized protein n=1 Tax=Araneus ventricosus TaxID=182803 RepID=A0A4Y2PKM6_ARAVE|nr:hypothetical protein AVEN_31437-1 [Araneus ventricosus]